MKTHINLISLTTITITIITKHKSTFIFKKLRDYVTDVTNAGNKQKQKTSKEMVFKPKTISNKQEPRGKLNNASPYGAI